LQTTERCEIHRKPPGIDEVAHRRSSEPSTARQRCARAGWSGNVRAVSLSGIPDRDGQATGSPPPQLERQASKDSICFVSELVVPGALARSADAELSRPLLSTERPWRDVYHYDRRGNLTGWTRYGRSARHRLHGGGLMVLLGDNDEPSTESPTVSYIANACHHGGHQYRRDRRRREVISKPHDTGGCVWRRVEPK